MATLFTILLSILVSNLNVANNNVNYDVPVMYCDALDNAVSDFNDSMGFHDASKQLSDLAISPALCKINMCTLWLRRAGSYPYRPRLRRSYPSVLFALLLLTSGDVHSNPGPTSLPFGSLNIRSAVDKAAAIHDIIADHQLSILALQETWISDSSSPCIKLDIAPEGYSVLHVYRSADNGHKIRGGGLAVVFNESIVVRQHKLNNVFKPSTFEVKLVRVNSSNSSVILANIYRPPDTSIPAFLDEFAELISSAAAGTTDRLLRCGDLNCPGADPATELEALFDSFGLIQHIS